jgi:hypothetical protein
VLDAVLVADPVEDVVAVVDVPCPGGELDSVVGQHGVNALGHGLDQLAQELSGFDLAGALDKAGDGELARAVASAGGCRPQRRCRISRLLRRIATNRRRLPASVLTSARSRWKYPIG